MTRHRLDLFSLLSGLALTLLAVLALVDGFTLDIARWLWPTVLISTGALVLVTVVGRSRSAADDATDDTGDDADLNADLDAAQHDPLPHHAD